MRIMAPFFTYASQTVPKVLYKIISRITLVSWWNIFSVMMKLHVHAGGYHLTGLVHISEVSWDLVHDVRDILTEGDEVKAKVINVDR